MPLPSIEITFRSLGMTAIRRSQKGVVALLLRDAKATGGHSLTGPAQIPTALSAENKQAIKRVFQGYVHPPRLVLPYVMSPEESLVDALHHLELQHFDYLAGLPDLSPEDAADLATWVKSQRENHHRRIKAVLPQTKADHEGIINLSTQGIVVGKERFSPAQFCGRIAGLIAGTPMTISSTFATLPEVSDVERKTKEDLDRAVDAGEFVLFHDGEKVKVGRGVNSLTSLTEGKGAAFQKIKIVEAMDMIYTDIRRTGQDHYIGKYANSYDNKCLLILAVQGYLEELEVAGILEQRSSRVTLNLEKQENYLKKQGLDTSEMTLQQIKEANTGSQVFLSAKTRILDAIEDIDLDIAI